MRIGFLTPEYPREGSVDGGLANYIRKIGNQLTDRNHDVVVFVQSDSDREYQDGKIQVIEVPRPKKPKFPRSIEYRSERFLPFFLSVRSAKRLEKAVWEYHALKPIDVLQTSSYGAPGYTLRKNRKIPLVCRISSYQAMVRAAYGKRRTFAEYLTDWLEIKQVMDADAAFAPSHFVARIYQRMEGFLPEVIETPLEAAPVNPDDSIYQSQFANFPYFLFCGTLSRIKGVDLIAEAIPHVLKQHPEMHFVFIGRDDGMPDGQKMMEFVLSKCKEFGKSIHYVPAIPKNQLYPILHSATAVLIPSRIDNCPNVCLEAHSLGIAVIGSQDSSLEEMITDGGTGILFSNSNPDALAVAMIRILQFSSQDRERMKTEICRSAESIRKEDRVGRLLQFYDKTIQNFRRH